MHSENNKFELNDYRRLTHTSKNRTGRVEESGYR